MSFRGHHGVREAERALAQDFTVDVEVECDLSLAAHSDQLADTVDYKQIHTIAREVIEGASHHLLESLAGEIADRVLDLPRIDAVSVRIAKQPVSLAPIGGAAVHIYRTRA